MTSEKSNQDKALQHDVEKDKNADQQNEIYALKLKLNVEKTILDDFFRLVVENSKDGINVLSLETGKYIYMNESQVELTGFSFEEIINISAEEAYDRLHPDDRIISVKQQRQIVAGNDIIDPVEYRWKVKSGEYRWFNDRRTLIKDKQGIAVALVGVSRDITDKKNQELRIQNLATALEQMNRDKDEFISILAHDIKDPFNALLGFTDLLLMNLHRYDATTMGSQLQLIHDTTLHAYNLLEEILLWGRSRLGKMDLSRVVFPFAEATSEVIHSYEVQAKEKNISIQIDDPEKLVLHADVYVFKTVLRNLLSNAIKFTCQNGEGEIKIVARQKQGAATITVSDNGKGIEKHVISTLWDISVHRSTPGTQKEKGTGFGLKLCKELIEKHGGEIWVESDVGKGTAVSFTLPSS